MKHLASLAWVVICAPLPSCYRDGSQKVAPAVQAPQPPRAVTSHDPSAAPTVQGQLRVVGGPGEKGVFKFTLRFTAPKVNELFAVATDVVALGTGKPIPGAKVTVNATMPEHGHGMTTAPEHRELSPGSWRAEGLKLHMHGKWVIEVKAEAAGQQDVLRVPWEQQP
jgi:hypothetical protein